MRALVTGITSMDGAYLAESLLRDGHEVIGIVRPGRSGLGNVEHLKDDLLIKEASLTNFEFMKSVLRIEKPDVIFNLAAISSYAQYNVDPVGSNQVNGSVPLIILEAIRQVDPKTRFFQAGSAQVFGNPITSPQDESTPFSPVTPYSASKAYAQFMVKQYREAHKLFASSAILFNHESPLRPMDFVTRKITSTVAKIKAGKADSLILGNLDVRRDWGFAGDYVEAMRLIAQADSPDDFVVGTSEVHTVREFVELSFKCAGIDDYERYVEIDPALVRKETSILQANPWKIKKTLGWEPRISFKELVKMMVENDLAVLG